MALPSSIGRLRSLSQLYLHSAPLQMMLLYDCLLLTTIATGNALTTLPPEIGGLTKLVELFLHDNHLKELPSSLGRLRQLRWLNISNNELTRLPHSMGRLKGTLTLLICEGLALSDKRYTDLEWLARQPPGAFCLLVSLFVCCCVVMFAYAVFACRGVHWFVHVECRPWLADESLRLFGFAIQVHST